MAEIDTVVFLPTFTDILSDGRRSLIVKLNELNPGKNFGIRVDGDGTEDVMTIDDYLSFYEEREFCYG